MTDVHMLEWKSKLNAILSSLAIGRKILLTSNLAHRRVEISFFRLCAPEDAGVSFVSHHHIVPIITYNRLYETETVLQYRIGKIEGLNASSKVFDSS